LEEHDFDGEENGRHGRAEDRGHAGRRAGDQQRLALRGAQVKELREERAQGAARHDDRALGAERAAGADRDRRGERLQHGYLRLYPALTDEDRLERLGYAVPADLRRAVAGHEADDQAADHRYQNGTRTELRVAEVGSRGGVDVEVAEVGDERNQLQE